MIIICSLGKYLSLFILLKRIKELYSDRYVQDWNLVREYSEIHAYTD